MIIQEQPRVIASTIFFNKPMEWTHHFSNEGLRLNKHYPISIDELKSIVNRFKKAYDNLEINEIVADNCMINDKLSTVTGIYAVTATTDTDKQALSGNWKVVFLLNEESGYWCITG